MAVDHYENFPVGSWLLPRELRDPILIIYRFARTADDFADEGSDPPEERLAKLDQFRAALDLVAAGRPPDEPLFRSVARIVRDHGLPLQPFRDLLDAFSQDVVKHRYANFGELLDYCRRSANPVGRLLLHLFRRATPDNLAASDSVCSALQLVNFWQDVAVDHDKGRIYLPQDEMARFHVTERQINERRCDERWRALIGFQIERARGMLAPGMRLGRELPGRVGLEIRATVQGGLRVLEKLEQARCDVFHQRPVLQWWDWPIIVGRSAACWRR